MKKLTERQAWLLLAKLWDKAKPKSPSGTYAVFFNDGSVSGLCACVGWINTNSRTRCAMIDKIRTGGSAIHRPYRWPRTLAGAKQRADFCRLQAKLCKRKKKS